MQELSKAEEQILLAVWRLKDEAYGITIRNYLQDVTARKYSIGGIYVPLDRLVRKGFLRSAQAEPTSERGGMSKRYYHITKQGILAMKDAKKVHDSLWENLNELETGIV